jgi:hypothetical protein
MRAFAALSGRVALGIVVAACAVVPVATPASAAGAGGIVAGGARSTVFIGAAEVVMRTVNPDGSGSASIYHAAAGTSGRALYYQLQGTGQLKGIGGVIQSAVDPGEGGNGCSGYGTASF